MASDVTQSVRPIVALSEDVVQKIAAGEVVVRPLNAVKELIENSIDAGATEITVTCKNGGLDLIKVKDNGCGINKEDYERVCERFSTSKLKTAADLQKISTFGFRGEALASISCMAKVQVTSRTREATHAWTASYKNSKPTSKPVPAAGLMGTQIAAEKLFHDYPQRRSVFNRPNEEAVGIANVLIKYAINFPHIKFAFVKDDGAKRSNGGAFCSLGNGDQHAVVRLLMPSNLTKKLFDFEIDSVQYKFSAKICMANPLSTHTSTAIKAKNDKQKIFQLFINNRLVSSDKLKKAVDEAFKLNDAYCPFIAISMQIEPSRIDVNVHPTKELVCFLDEAQIIDLIGSKLFDVMDNFRQKGIIDFKGPGHFSSTQNTPNSSQKSFALNRTALSSNASSAQITPVTLQRSVVDLQNPSAKQASFIRQSPSISQTPTILYQSPSTSFEISPIKGNCSSLNLGQKRKHDASVSNNFSKPKVTQQECDDDNSGAKYKFDMAQAFAKMYAQPNSAIRVDSSNHSIREYTTPNTTLDDVTWESLPPGEVSVYSEADNSLLPGEQTTYSEADNSLLPEERTIYSENANETTLNETGVHDYSDLLNKTVGELPDDRGKHVFKALSDFQSESSVYLTSIVRKFVFVGYVDVTHAIFQSENSIFMIELMPLLEEVFYQKCLHSASRQDGCRVIINTKEYPGGLPLLALVDTYLSICPSAPLPNEMRFDSKEDAAEDLVAKFYQPEIVELLWDFGVSITIDDQQGPLLNAIVTQVDGYDLLLSQQVAQFGYELACIDWNKPELAGRQIARTVARLHTPYQIAHCTETAAKEQCEMIKDRLMPFLKTDFFVPEKLEPHFTKLLSTVDAYKIFGRC